MAELTKRRYLCLRPLPLSALPTHRSLPVPGTSPPTVQPELHTFLSEILTEGTSFADEGLPALFSAGQEKQSPPSSAKVQLLTATLPAAYGDVALGKGEEAWFARRSKHQNASQSGTAGWREFVGGLLENHSLNEGDYTPDVVDAHEVASWNEKITQELNGGTIDNFTEVGMAVYEMVHHIPPPLNNRVFCTLVVTGKTSPTAFTVIQIPVDLADFPEDRVLYANGRNRQDGESADAKKKVTVGVYTSVERVRLVKEGTTDEAEDGNEVIWEMATASDAKGTLPMWAQKMGVPGAVVKDVGLFMDWTAKRRS